MDNKVKVPGGAFYAGDGLTVDPVTRTVSAGGGGGSGASVQSDWNQNDSTAADYVKNRPFYTGDPVETVLVEESTVSFTNPSANLYYGAISTTIKLTVGGTYKVSWDGATYECVCGLIMGNPAIGNLSIMGAGADTGEPFVISPIADDGGTEIYTLDTSASHTFSISGLVTEVVKIPDKYLNRHTHILAQSFWESSSKSELIDIVNQFKDGDVFVYQHSQSTAAFLLSAGYSESSGFIFVYMYGYAIVKITGGVGNWTTNTATIAYS